MQVMTAVAAMVGFSAQAMFSARIAVQWLMSEKARKVVSPTAFWVLSLCGSLLLCVYGWMRSDFSIVFGQSVSYYVYLWNLNAKGLWQRTAPPVRLALMAVPPVAAPAALDTLDLGGALLMLPADRIGCLPSEPMPARVSAVGRYTVVCYGSRLSHNESVKESEK